MHISTNNFWKATYVMFLIPEGMNVSVRTWLHYQLLWYLSIPTGLGFILLLILTKKNVKNTVWYIQYQKDKTIHSDYDFDKFQAIDIPEKGVM